VIQNGGQFFPGRVKSNLFSPLMKNHSTWLLNMHFLGMSIVDFLGVKCPGIRFYSFVFFQTFLEWHTDEQKFYSCFFFAFAEYFRICLGNTIIQFLESRFVQST